MASAEPDLLDIVGDLHEGVADPACWTRGLDRLSDRLGESRILLGSLRRGQPGIEMLGHRVTSSELLERIAGPLGNPMDNPFVAAAWSAPLRCPVTVDDIGEARLKASRIWTEAFLAGGMRDAMGTPLERLPERAEICLVYRPVDPFDADDRRLFEALIPHIARAWRVRRAVAQWRGMAEDMAAVLDRLDRGVIITGNDGAVRFANRAAERLLSAGDGIDATRGRLRAGRPADTDRLTAMVARATRTGVGRDASAVDAVALPRGGTATPLAVVAEPLAPAHGEQLGQGSHGAVLFVSDADASSAPSPERLQLVYSLSAAEAAFAARVLHGDGIAAAAAALGISENTGKTHLKAVFEKVGVTRQAELVRRVIADVGGLCDAGGHGPDGAAEAVAAAGPRD